MAKETLLQRISRATGVGPSRASPPYPRKTGTFNCRCPVKTIDIYHCPRLEGGCSRVAGLGGVLQWAGLNPQTRDDLPIESLGACQTCAALYRKDYQLFAPGHDRILRVVRFNGAAQRRPPCGVATAIEQAGFSFPRLVHDALSGTRGTSPRAWIVVHRTPVPQLRSVRSSGSL